MSLRIEESKTVINPTVVERDLGRVVWSIGALAAADTALGAVQVLAPFAAGTFTFVAGDYTGQADGFRVVQATGIPLSTGAWVRQEANSIVSRAMGEGSIFRTAQDRANDTVTANDYGAVPDWAEDNPSPTNSALAVRKAILAILWRTKGAGGRITFAPGSYYYGDTVTLPSNIHIDQTGARIIGNSDKPLYETGYYTGAMVLPNLNSADENPNTIVQNAQITGGRLFRAKLCFDFKNFVQRCLIANIQTRDCLQVGVMKRCFSYALEDIDARGGSSLALPTWDLDGQANSITVTRVKCVTGWGWKLTGANGIKFLGWEFEGGTRGFVMMGDCLGLDFDTGYGENSDGDMFDFSNAAACSVTWYNNYFNGVKRVVNDGGANSPATLTGIWYGNNQRVNSTGNSFVNTMDVAGRRNFIEWQGQPLDNVPIGFEAGGTNSVSWNIGPGTRYCRVLRLTGAGGLADVRASTRDRRGAIVETERGGDTGTPSDGSVPFCTYTYPASATATIDIDTRIKWQPDSLFAKYVLSVTENEVAGSTRVFGDIYGSDVKQADNKGKTATLSNVGGFVRLSLGPFNNANNLRNVTGTVQIVT